MWYWRFFYEPWVFSRHQAEYITYMYAAVVSQFFYDNSVPKYVIQSKDNSEVHVVFKRPNLNIIFRRLPSRGDVCFGRPCRRLFSLFSDSLYCFPIPAELLCNYIILNSITFEPYNLNSIPITNVPTGTYYYNAQT